MKKILLTSIIGLLAIFLYAQAPNYFKYQTVIRDSNGDLITNQDVSFRISILVGSETGSEIYNELHNVTSNSYGLCNLEIGNGSSPSSDFSLISWGSNTFYLKIELDISGGSSFTEMGTVQLLSVPYSLHANSATKAMAIDNPVLYFTDTDTLFAVKDRSGNLVFAVFPDGAVVYVNETVKGKVGGFAVSGRSPSKATEYDVMRITPDSSRIYVNQTAVKAKVGGFAVSGRSPSKLGEEEYLVVTADSTRIYVNQSATKGKVGGFAVSGRSPSKSTLNNFMDITPENYFIGQGSGINISEGILNSALGFESGVNLTTGSSNAFLGYQSGYNTIDGSGNLFLGYQSGFSNVIGDYNTFVGYQSGQSNVDGKNNTFLGSFAGKNNIGGSYNTFVGDSTGYNNTSGYNNTFLGTKVGYNNTEGYANLFMGNFAGFSNLGGFENIFLGDFSGYSNVASGMNVAIGVRSGFYGVSGWNNVYLGTETGYKNTNGEGNVFIGYQTGMNNTGGTRNIFIGNRAGMDEQGSGKLIIDNTDLDSTGAFIWGDMYARLLRFNANIGIGTNPGYFNTLSIYDSDGPSIVNIMGIGNTYDYSQLRLEADIGTDTLSYQLIHDIDNRFRIFYDDGTNLFPRIGIDVSGNVMIGGAWEDATEMLDVAGNARFRLIESGAYQGALNYTSDGRLTTSTSDIRLKENIKTLENSLDKILRLRGVNFTWKSDPELGARIGFIAQEVEKVIPELVFENEVDGYKGVNYEEMSAVLVEAIKEMKTENEELKLRISKLEAITNELLNK
ncbi:MAG: hypothetical protein C0597_14910 [Marinilabiliales bacterium]|nr:MAG: hypothetical protein C0597_14910 [Marinilabiliales bacterium]